MKTLNVETCPLEGTQLIEASAGTGKTFTIALLYVRMILERDLGPEDLLVVTYTRAATAELRRRIRERLEQALAVIDDVTEPKADDPIGPILATRETAIDENETAGELEERLSLIGVEATLESVELLANWVTQ